MSGTRTLRPLVLIAVPLLAGYYLFYLRSRERYFTDLNFRALAVLSEQIQGAIEGRKSALENAAAEATRHARVHGFDTVIKGRIALIPAAKHVETDPCPTDVVSRTTPISRCWF